MGRRVPFLIGRIVGGDRGCFINWMRGWEMKKSLQIAGAYIGLIVGAGFASGQEILQFFTGFGLYGFIGIAIAGLLFAFLGMHVVKTGSILRITSYKRIFYRFCGQYLGAPVDVFVTFFLFGVGAVMIAGSGSLFEQQFGFDPMIGNIIMATLVFATLILNVEKVVTVISLVAPYLFVLILAITGYAIFWGEWKGESLQAGSAILPKAAPNFLAGSFLYVSYNISAGVAMLAIIGGTAKDERIAGRGGILGGVGLGLLILLLHIAMLINVEKIAEFPMPTLRLATEISPVVGWMSGIALLGMIYNTAVGMLYAFTTRFIMPGTKKFKIGVAVIVLLALVSSRIGFVDLVGTVYPVSGYLGMTVIIAIFIHWFRGRRRPLNVDTDPSIKG